MIFFFRNVGIAPEARAAIQLQEIMEAHGWEQSQ